MKERPVIYLVIGILVLIIPTAIYLCFLIPSLSEEYNILMTSGGIIGSAGLYGSSLIPKNLKHSSLFKLAANSFTILTVITLVQEFILELIGLVSVFILCFIAFTILKEVWKNGRERLKSEKLATEISRSIIENIK